MIITQEIKLELNRIDFVENPMNYKGNFISYQFNMYYPSEYAFFNESGYLLSKDNDITVIWGRSPCITYYTKENIKTFKQELLRLIKEELPEGYWEIRNYHLAWTGASNRGDRDWQLFYMANKFSRKGCQVFNEKLESRIILNKNFMSRLIALIPEKLKSKFGE